MAGTYLGRIVGYIIDQAPMALVGQIVMLLMPAILVKTFTMAVLLAALLAFGRLSSDSEIVALRAGGASIYRIVAPVATFSLAIALVTFWFNEQIVPNAAAQSLRVMKEIAASKGIRANQPVAFTLVEKGKLRGFLNAQNVNPATRALQGVTLFSYDEKEQPSWVLHAKEMQFDRTNPAKKWRIEGKAQLVSPDYSQFIDFEGAWPQQIGSPAASFDEIVAERKDEFETMNMADLKKSIETHRERGDWKAAEIANAEYGYWNKISVPMAAFVFGTLGAVLGIRNHRTGTASGFALAVGIIFGYMMLANFMSYWAQGGFLPAYIASFSPVIVGFVASWIIMWRRNV